MRRGQIIVGRIVGPIDIRPRRSGSNFERRLRVLSTPGVHFLVMFAGRPAPIPDLEMDAIRKAVESKLRVEPHPFLRCGDWVRVTSGPLADVEGIIDAGKNSRNP